jgi:glycosyltransferase involved in cell wall biosynthesis
MPAPDPSFRPRFTIITAVYRGARFLPSLHEHLKRLAPNSPPFEWILVDDGSPDEGATVAEMQRIEAESPLPVTCVYLPRNYYGSESVKTASRMARGEYIVILDQDDTLTDDALWIFQRGIERHESRADFAGVCGRCVDMEGRFIGTSIPGGELYANEFEMRHFHRIRGEMLQCTRTELIREHFAKMRPGFTNGYVWARIARGHRFLYTNAVVRNYDTGNPDSWLHERRIKYACNLYRETSTYLNVGIRYVLWDPLQLLRLTVHCRRFEYHARRCDRPVRLPTSRLARAAMAVVTPVSLWLARRDVARGRVSCGT